MDLTVHYKIFKNLEGMYDASQCSKIGTDQYCVVPGEGTKTKGLLMETVR